MIYGYMGKLLFVNLTTGKISEETRDESFYRKYIGGAGLGARILYDRMPAGADPLGPDNILGFTTGPLTGVPGLQASRFIVVCKSPLTGAWADSNSGGYFAPYLKYAGYDAVFFSGISPKPVYLHIQEGRAEIKDASHLWGKDTNQTDSMLKAELISKVAVACIGPAAERLSLITGVINDKGCAAARNGVGAVMGSKKLKAVTVYGTQKVPINREKVKQFSKEYARDLRNGVYYPLFHNLGTPGANSGFLAIGEMPLRNWWGSIDTDVPGKNAKILDGSKLIPLQDKPHRCLGCTVACKGRMKAGNEYDYPPGVHRPEYETWGTLGTMCLNWNIESVIMMNHLCNSYSFDTISAGSTLSFAIECYENGIINKEDTGGIELTWGNHKAMVEMLDKMGKREGFGDVLADGSKKASERIGRGSERFAVHAGRQEPGMHDPRINDEWLGAHICDPAVGRHTSGAKNGEDYWMQRTLDNLGMCTFQFFCLPEPAVYLVKMANIATGWDMDLDELKLAARRSMHLRQAFTSREGITMRDMQFQDCKRPVGDPPLENGPLAGITKDQDAFQKEFCEKIEWDFETGKPLKESLVKVGLDDVASSLWE
jgi:aldehyde:ferredoxin oxidoreductase